jgi:hypothetical protein
MAFKLSFLSSDYYENHDLSPKPSKRQGARIGLNVRYLPDITAWLDSDTALFKDGAAAQQRCLC